MEKTVTQKADVIDWLKRSLDAVATARAQLKPTDFQRKVSIDGKTVTVDGMYLRIIVHANEHMGQSIAYARMNGIVPPWSKSRLEGMLFPSRDDDIYSTNAYAIWSCSERRMCSASASSRQVFTS